jgi:hypothetical protein
MSDKSLSDERNDQDYDVVEHLLSVTEVAEKYATSVDVDQPHRSGGLSTTEVRKKWPLAKFVRTEVSLKLKAYRLTSIYSSLSRICHRAKGVPVLPVAFVLQMQGISIYPCKRALALLFTFGSFHLQREHSWTVPCRHCPVWRPMVQTSCHRLETSQNG